MGVAVIDNLRRVKSHNANRGYPVAAPGTNSDEVPLGYPFSKWAKRCNKRLAVT